jgi:hypothetical protein
MSTKDKKTTKAAAKKETKAAPASKKETKAAPAAKKETKAAPAAKKETKAAPASKKETKAAPAAKKETKAAAKPKAAPAAAGAKAAQKAQTPKAPKAKKVAKKGAKPKKKVNRFVVDLTDPVEDGILDPNSFEKYLHDRIKVNGKAGQLGNSVKITRDQTKLTIHSHVHVSKKYVKYLTTVASAVAIAGLGAMAGMVGVDLVLDALPDPVPAQRYYCALLPTLITWPYILRLGWVPLVGLALVWRVAQRAVSSVPRSSAAAWVASAADPLSLGLLGIPGALTFARTLTLAATLCASEAHRHPVLLRKMLWWHWLMLTVILTALLLQVVSLVTDQKLPPKRT